MYQGAANRIRYASAPGTSSDNGAHTRENAASLHGENSQHTTCGLGHPEELVKPAGD